MLDAPVSSPQLYGCSCSFPIFRQFSFISKILEQLILKTVYMKDKKIISGCQDGLTKGKSCLTNLISFYNGTTGLVDNRRAADIVYLDFSKAFKHCLP